MTSANQIIKARMRTNPIYWLASGFGSGLVPYCPGTAGTLFAVPLVWGLQMLPTALFAAITVLAFFFGLWICRFVSDDLGVSDHPAIVWDEIVGYMVTMIAAPEGFAWMALGFGLFRFFDILKPWPIRWIDAHVSGGMGIMADDVLAGACASATIFLIDTGLG